MIGVTGRVSNLRRRRSYDGAVSVGADERIQPALHALLSDDVDGLREALGADPEVVNLKVGDNTLLELTTQPTSATRPRRSSMC